MFYSVEPALAARLAEKIRAARQQPRHRMIEPAHQRAVDEQVVGDHGAAITPSLRANGSRECAPDDKLREAIHKAARKVWIASSLALLAMTKAPTRITPPPPHR